MRILGVPLSRGSDGLLPGCNADETGAAEPQASTTPEEVLVEDGDAGLRADVYCAIEDVLADVFEEVGVHDCRRRGGTP
jgi:hypothetical protein